ncbi:RING finger protein 37 isoform X2 [Nematostella vectensis]|uniref:RING finger protein 37 isoform X2 n=1 Tax=Nematostella vectensis TaxID=45351 RepID=UPI002076DAA4|nr:RING finger protein 37 isoform X2 [Nematostella vectensis]
MFSICRPSKRELFIEHALMVYGIKMIINLTESLFSPRLQCSSVCCDGYSPNNLISENWRERSQGFLAAHFVKPPVDLLFQLPFPVNIESVLIKPKVGSQISCGIDVFVAGIVPVNQPSQKRKSRNTKQNDSVVTQPDTGRKSSDGKELNFKSDNSVSLSDAWHNYSTMITPSSFKSNHHHLFTQVCRSYDTEGRALIMRNRRFQERAPIKGTTSMDGGETSERDFLHTHSLYYVTHVVVRVWRVVRSSVPAIGKVDIFGQVSASCSPTIVQQVIDIQNKAQEQSQQQSTCSLVEDLKNTMVSKNELECGIPAEFLDPITCILMTVPILLPSGENVDSSTLDKHIEAERQWGRLPSDPFTGVLLNDSYKPVPNAALKARIDKYILTSGIDMTSRGRTVGKVAIEKTAILPSSSSSTLVTNCTQRRIIKIPEASVKICGSEKNDLHKGGAKTSPSNCKTMRQTPGEKLRSTICKSCSRSLEKQPAFQLPCKHLICRGCLTGRTAGQMTCVECKSPYTHASVSRVHSTYL